MDCIGVHWGKRNDKSFGCDTTPLIGVDQCSTHSSKLNIFCANSLVNKRAGADQQLLILSRGDRHVFIFIIGSNIPVGQIEVSGWQG
jgi:hypothetical protein